MAGRPIPPHPDEIESILKLKKLLSPEHWLTTGSQSCFKTTALAERGKHTVLVVDADLHHASVTETLGLKAWAGLTDCLVDDGAPLLSAIRRIEPLGWFLLPAGEPCKNPTELLQTRAFGNILDQLTPCFDWILIGSPPVLSLTDSISLQQHADAALLVVRAGQTPREAVEQTIELLGNKNILGIVLNGVETRDHPYYHYYGSTVEQHDH